MLRNNFTSINRIYSEATLPIIGRLSRTQKMLLMLLVMNVLWGAAWVPYKVILSEWPVPVFAFVRSLLTVLILAPLALRAMRHHRLAGGIKFGWKQMPRLALLTLVGVVLNNVFLYSGASIAPVTDASLLAITETLFTTFLAWFFFKERFTGAKTIGLALGAFGVYVLVAQGFYLPNFGQSGQALGDLLLLLGFGFESLYTLLGTGSSRRFPPIALITATNLMGMLFWGPAAAFSLQQQNWVFPALDWQGIASLAYLVLVFSVIGYLIWFKTLRHVEASLVSTTLFVQPLAGSFIGFALLGETLSLFNLVGGGLIALSLGLLANSSRHRAEA